MDALAEYLKGKKTYLISFLLILLAGLHSQGYLNDSSYGTLVGMLTGAGLAALRAGVAKSGK